MYKDWATNKKKKPGHVTDDDDNDAAPFAGVKCARHAGMQKNTCAHKLKNEINLNIKELMLLDSEGNVTIICNNKQVKST